MIKIGKILQDAGLVTAQDIDKAVVEQKRTGKFLGNILIEMGKLTETDLLKCLSVQMRIPFVSLKDAQIELLGKRGRRPEWIRFQGRLFRREAS